MDDPIGYFDHSVTQMHGVPRAELEPLQRAAMARRFAQHRESIGMVGKLADRLGDQTPLEVITSSGTTGTLSIIPKDKTGATYGMKMWRIFVFQTFGREP